MKTKVLFLLFFWYGFSYAQDYEFIINDSLLVNLKEDRIEQIEIEVEVKNNVADNFRINKEIGIIVLYPPALDEQIESYCEDYNWEGVYHVLIYDDSNQLFLPRPTLAMHSFYFKKNGKLKRGYSSVRKYIKSKAKPIKMIIEPYQQERFRMKIFLGGFTFEKGKHYYLKLKYTNGADDNLTKVTCLESNKMVLITK